MTSVVAESNTSLSRCAAAVTALKLMGGWSLAPILEEPSHGCIEDYISGPPPAEFCTGLPGACQPSL